MLFILVLLLWHKGMWHNGLISATWLKIGGDKCGGSFKMLFQIVNTSHPDSPVNTFVFCAFETPDTWSNLHWTATDSKLRNWSLKWGVSTCTVMESNAILYCGNLHRGKVFISRTLVWRHRVPNAHVRAVWSIQYVTPGAHEPPKAVKECPTPVACVKHLLSNS